MMKMYPIREAHSSKQWIFVSIIWSWPQQYKLKLKKKEKVVGFGGLLSKKCTSFYSMLWSDRFAGEKDLKERAFGGMTSGGMMACRSLRQFALLYHFEYYIYSKSIPLREL